MVRLRGRTIKRSTRPTLDESSSADTTGVDDGECSLDGGVRRRKGVGETRNLRLPEIHLPIELRRQLQHHTENPTRVRQGTNLAVAGFPSLTLCVMAAVELVVAEARTVFVDESSEVRRTSPARRRRDMSGR